MHNNKGRSSLHLADCQCVVKKCWTADKPTFLASIILSVMDKTYLSSLSIKSWNSQLKQDAQWVCKKSALKDHKLGIMNFKGQEFKFFVKYWYSLINLELYNWLLK